MNGKKPDCRCMRCTGASTGLCDQCRSSHCARAQWHGFMCNEEADRRHGFTRRYQTDDDPIGFRMMRGEGS